MVIRVLRNYGGKNTRERRILPGIYDSSDPALFGVADYLVQNGYATVIEPDIPPAVKQEQLAEAKPRPEQRKRRPNG